MCDVFDIFRTKYPDFRYKLKTFCKWRPLNILTTAKGAKITKCICTYHSKVTRKLNALNTICRKTGNEQLMITNSEKLNELTLCDKSDDEHNLACIKRECSLCGPENILCHFSNLLVSHSAQVVNWTKWKKVEREKFDKKTGKKEMKMFQEVASKSGYLMDLFEELLRELVPFSLHIFRTRWQWRELKSFQNKLPLTDALFIADFSENLAIQFSEETIASHVKSTSVSLFVAALYRHRTDSSETETKTTFENINILTNCNKHDSHLVHACTKIIMQHCRSKPEMPIKRMHRFTDGCAGQFRSRHCLRDLSFVAEDFGVNEMIVNYGETSEFKNVTDGLGGVVKRLITNSILLADDLVISSAEDIVAFANEKFQISNPDVPSDEHQLTARVFYYIDEKQIDRSRPERLGKVVPGIQSTRSIRSLKPGFVAFRNISCYCDSCLNGEWDVCLKKSHVENWSIRHCRPENNSLACCEPRNPSILQEM